MRALRRRAEQIARGELCELGQAACDVPAPEALRRASSSPACRDLFLARPRHYIAPA